MDKVKLASELVRIAEELVAMEFSTEESMREYLREHPSANPASHHVKPKSHTERDRVYDIHHASDRVAGVRFSSTSVGSEVELLRDAKNKNGEFKAGEKLKIVKYGKDYPYSVQLVAQNGRTISFLAEGAWKKLRGFPKPPSISTVERWNEEGVARSVDGQRVEPDGYSPDGAPSWCLVLGLI